ncbi:sugar ABC transporter permease [Atrimonas thermophila]|jgi:ABC-type sugar transport system permease subunit
MSRIRILQQIKKIFTPYWYFLLLLTLVGALMIYPLVDGVYLSFWRKNLLYPAKDKLIWFGNYYRLLFKDELFWLAFKNSAIFTAASVFFEYLLGLGSALLLNSKYIRFKNLMRGIVLLPWVVPIAVNSLNWKWMLLPDYGFINQFLKTIGLGSLARGWLSDLNWVFPTVVLVNVWRSFPFYTVTILAGLTLIPRELYEAAHIDGANRWQVFRYITFPGIKGVSMVIVILHVVWTFANFDVIYLLTGGGPLHRTEVLPTYLYQQAFNYFKMGYAASIGVFIFLFLLITVGLYFSKISTLYER